MRMFFVCFFFTFFLCSTFCLSSVLIFHTCWPGAAAGDDAGPGGGKSPYRGGGEGGGKIGKCVDCAKDDVELFCDAAGETFKDQQDGKKKQKYI